MGFYLNKDLALLVSKMRLAVLLASLLIVSMVRACKDAGKDDDEPHREIAPYGSEEDKQKIRQIRVDRAKEAAAIEVESLLEASGDHSVDLYSTTTSSSTTTPSSSSSEEEEEAITVSDYETAPPLFTQEDDYLVPPNAEDYFESLEHTDDEEEEVEDAVDVEEAGDLMLEEEMKSELSDEEE